MAERVVLPKMGATMTEGTITEWFVQDGDTVAADQPLFSFETDKIDTEVSSETAGTIRVIQPGDATVPAGALGAYVLAEGEELPAELPTPSVAYSQSPSAPAEPGDGPRSELANPRPRPGGRVRASPTAKRLAEDHGLDLARLPGTASSRCRASSPTGASVAPSESACCNRCRAWLRSRWPWKST